MAIYHLHVQTIGRGGGKSAVAAAAYRSTSKLVDRETGIVCDYTRKEKALDAGIIAPENSPEWVYNRDELWNGVQEKENRKNSQFAWEYDVAIPHEVSKEKKQIIAEFCKKNFVSQGLICDWAIHAPGKKGDQRNIHAHIMVTTRKMTAEGWGEKFRVGESNKMSDRQNWLNQVRESWAEVCNLELKNLYDQQKFDQNLERVKHKNERGFYADTGPKPELIKIDHRTLSAQNVERQVQQHQGPTATAIERKGKKPDRTRTPKPAGEKIQESPEFENFEKEAELKTAQLALKLLASSPENWKKEFTEFERLCKNEESRSRAVAVHQFLPEIEKANFQEIEKAKKTQKELLDKKPNGISEKPNVLKNFFYEYQADDGKKYPYEKYEKVQKGIIENWQKSVKANDEKGEGLNKERNLILAVKRDTENSGKGLEAINRSLRLGAEQESRRPALFSKIKEKARELLDNAREFLTYRNIKNVFEEVKAAREETAPREREQARKREPRSWSR